MVAGGVAAAAGAGTAHGQAALLRTLSVGPVSAVAFSPGGDRRAVGGTNNAILIWETAGWRTVRNLEGHTGQVNSVSGSPDDALLASGSNDSAIRLWGPAPGATVAVLAGHTDWVTAVAFSPNGVTLASTARRGVLPWGDDAVGRCRGMGDPHPPAQATSRAWGSAPRGECSPTGPATTRCGLGTRPRDWGSVS
ncbi:MAG: hypothetical protein Kow0097_02440 [Candidatus Bipolaricaulota bacterium]